MEVYKGGSQSQGNPSKSREPQQQLVALSRGADVAWEVSEATRGDLKSPGEPWRPGVLRPGPANRHQEGGMVRAAVCVRRAMRPARRLTVHGNAQGLCQDGGHSELKPVFLPRKPLRYLMLPPRRNW